ncbi:MAG: hypothetical protein HY819_07580 [Acidobacteria bacterium]|nr:hypothetical protein [Acidobacteriota bacterium]
MDNNQRIIIHNIGLLANGNIQVELKYIDKIYQKTVAPTDEDDKLFAATRATIDALNQIIPTPIVTRVSEIQQIKFQELSEFVVVTLVGIRIKGEEKLYPGSAKAGSSTVSAVVRATLDAVNRPVGLFL